MLPQLSKLEEDLGHNLVKIQQSGKFINYFVHDILDFSVLREDGHKFVKNETVFDIRDCIKEIISLQEDKAALKGIEVVSLFEEFPQRLQMGESGPCYLVKTDQKRL